MDTVKTERSSALSVGERDRRYGLVRQAMRYRGMDALIVAGSNLLYLSGGLPGEFLGILPGEQGEDFESLINWRHLVDIPKEVMLGSQEWVTRVRSGRNAAPLADRIRELKLENSTIGYAGGLSHDAYNALMKAVPAIKMLDASELLNNVRTIKSAEEIALIDRANHVFNAAIEAIQAKGRPNMLGREIVQIGLNAMWTPAAISPRPSRSISGRGRRKTRCSPNCVSTAACSLATSAPSRRIPIITTMPAIPTRRSPSALPSPPMCVSLRR